MQNFYVTLYQTKKFHYTRRDGDGNDFNNEHNPEIEEHNDNESTLKPEDLVTSSRESAQDDKKWFWNSKV